MQPRSATPFRAWQIANRCSLLLRQCEREERAAVRRPEHLGQEALGPAAPAARRDDVLPSVDAVARRAAVVAAAALELPEHLTAVRVPRVELPAGLAAEHEIAASGQQRRAHAQLAGPAPLLLSGTRIVGAHVAGLVLAVHSHAGAPVRDALLELPAPPRGGCADVLHRDVEELRLRAVARVRPFLGSGGPGPEVDGVAFR